MPSGFQTPITIAEALKSIDQRRFLLPAIQRKFVWTSNQIELLFDSLMQGYPISSFLFWEVRESQRNEIKFYEFLRDYREHYHDENPIFSPSDNQPFISVLDGQQRLTALYIGLNGTYAYKIFRRQWANNEHSIPTRKLYMNVGDKPNFGPGERDDNRHYNFRFLTESEYNNAAGSANWFEVRKILDFSKGVSPYQLFEFLSKSYPNNRTAHDLITKLKEVVHDVSLINYYLEQDQDYDKALNIFIRTNSAGISLSYGDLLMSILVASWERINAREAFDRLIQEIGDRFQIWIPKEMILRTYFILFKDDIKLRPSNLTKENTAQFEDYWEKISNSIRTAVELVYRFGYDNHTLTSKNALLPIVFHVYHNGYELDFATSTQFKVERNQIQQWLQVVLLYRVFGGHSDNALVGIRKAQRAALESGSVSFPVKLIIEELSRIGKSLTVDEDFLDSLLETQKDHPLAFSILALLQPEFDYRNRNLHKDHLHPASSFTKAVLRQHGIDDQHPDWDVYSNPLNWNSILNLQLLDPNENSAKHAKTLTRWASELGQDKRNALMIPDGLSFEAFPEFISQRRRMLKERLQHRLSIEA